MHWVYRITEIRENSFKLTTTFVRFCEILGGFQWFQRISVIPDTPLDTPFPSPLFRFSLRKCLTICCYIAYIVFKDAFTSRFINTYVYGFLYIHTPFLRIICCTSCLNRQNRKQHVGVLGKVTIIKQIARKSQKWHTTEL